MKINYKILESEQVFACSLEEVKNYLRISHNYDDQLLRSLIVSATDSAEIFMGMNISKKHIQCDIAGLNKESVLKYFPVFEVKSFKTGGNKDALKPVDNKGSLLINSSRKIIITPGYSEKYIQVEYTVGYAQERANNIPASIKHGILMHVSQMYDSGDMISNNLMQQVYNLYKPYRSIKI